MPPAIVRLAEAEVNVPLLMATNRHSSLQRDARPGSEAVAEVTAEHDPDRR